MALKNETPKHPKKWSFWVQNPKSFEKGIITLKFLRARTSSILALFLKSDPKYDALFWGKVDDVISGPSPINLCLNRSKMDHKKRTKCQKGTQKRPKKGPKRRHRFWESGPIERDVFWGFDQNLSFREKPKKSRTPRVLRLFVFWPFLDILGSRSWPPPGRTPPKRMVIIRLFTIRSKMFRTDKKWKRWFSVFSVVSGFVPKVVISGSTVWDPFLGPFWDPFPGPEYGTQSASITPPFMYSISIGWLCPKYGSQKWPQIWPKMTDSENVHFRVFQEVIKRSNPLNYDHWKVIFTKRTKSSPTTPREVQLHLDLLSFWPKKAKNDPFSLFFGCFGSEPNRHPQVFFPFKTSSHPKWTPRKPTSKRAKKGLFWVFFRCFLAFWA